MKIYELENLYDDYDYYQLTDEQSILVNDNGFPFATTVQSEKAKHGSQLSWAANMYKESFGFEIRVVENYKQPGPVYEELLNKDLTNHKGIGLTVGVDDIRVLDIDEININVYQKIYGIEDYHYTAFIEEILSILGLPANYPWVMYSGSGDGIHIIFKSPSFENEMKELSFLSNRKYEDLFFRMELIWKGFLVLPPSIGWKSRKYKFRHEIPTTSPIEISAIPIYNTFTHFCAYNTTETLEYLDQSHPDWKDQFRFARRCFVFREPSDRIWYTNPEPESWLKHVGTPEALNTLAFNLLFGGYDEFERDCLNNDADFHMIYELLSNNKSIYSDFNIASLISLQKISLSSEDMESHMKAAAETCINYFEGDGYNDITANTLLNQTFTDFRKTYERRSPLTKKRILFFDTETTGLPRDYNAPTTDSSNWPRLVQLAWVVTDGFGIEKNSGDKIIKPDGFTIPASITLLHGISTLKAIQNGESLKHVLGEFMQAFESCDIIVGHNIAFDKHIMGAELVRCGLEDVMDNKPYFCTMEAGTDFCHMKGIYGNKPPKLAELYERIFGHRDFRAHNANADVSATVDCFFGLQSKGVFNLYDIWFKNIKNPLFHGA